MSLSLSPWDDYPIHQTSYPIAHPVAPDVGRYDRDWMTMHDRELTTQVGFGMSVHPNRGIVDGAFSVVRGDRQRSVYVSGPLRPDRSRECGPLRLEVLEPMRSHRLVLDSYQGMAAELTWTGVTRTIVDNRMERWAGSVLVAERTRTVQFGEWSGEVEIDGERITVTSDAWWGMRDRSWGSRTTGTVAEGELAAELSSIYFAWTLLRFPDECLLVAVNETPDGRGESRTAAVLPFLTAGEPAYGDDEKIARSDAASFAIDYIPETRRAAAVGVTVGPRGAVQREIRLEPKLTFVMKGLGYSHPTWRHGTDHGGPSVGFESWCVSDCDPTRRENAHVQQLVRATRSDGVTGVGLFEHVAIGPHAPSGLGDGLAPRGDG